MILMKKLLEIGYVDYHTNCVEVNWCYLDWSGSWSCLVAKISYSQLRIFTFCQ